MERVRSRRLLTLLVSGIVLLFAMTSVMACSNVSTPTPDPTATLTPVPADTATATPTQMPRPTDTPTHTPTATPTLAPVPTPLPTATLEMTQTPIPPTLASVTVNGGATSGIASGGYLVTITGTGFVANPTVTFGITPATNIEFSNSTSIVAIVPAYAGPFSYEFRDDQGGSPLVGVVAVVVTNPDGQSGTLTKGFTYVAPPSVTSINHTSGSISGGNDITITGAGFASGTTVKFGSTQSSIVVTGEPTQILATAPAHDAGTVDITVTNPDGQFSTLPNAFTFLAPIQVDTAAPIVDGQSLWEAIDGAGSETAITLSLKGGDYYIPGTLEIEDKNITINVIDSAAIIGNNSFGVFSVASGGELTLNNMNVTGGSAEYGGAIRNDGGTVTLIGSTVIGNTAIYGGGIFSGGGTVTLTDSSVQDNTAPLGGGILNEGGTVRVKGSSVHDNTATHGGGILNDLSGTVTLTDSSVHKNTADHSGGGIYNRDGTVTLDRGSTVSDNMAESDGGGGIYNLGTVTLIFGSVSGNTAVNGGGIYNRDGTVTLDGGSSVSSNTAFHSGGGIYNDGGTVTLDGGSSVSGNTAVNGGGGVWNEYGMITLTDSTVSGNTASGGDEALGGGIANTGTVTLDGGSSVSGNTAGGGGGISNARGGTVTLTDSTVQDNTAGFIGGGIYIGDGTVTLTDSSVGGNTAGEGGGVYNFGTVNLTDSTVQWNKAGGGGGGIYNASNATVKLDGSSTVHDNEARKGEGGGIYIYFKATCLRGSDVHVYHNYRYNEDPNDDIYGSCLSIADSAGP